MLNDTLQRIASNQSTTQQKVVDHFTKPTEFLKRVPFITSSHGFTNEYEEWSNVVAGEFREFDAPSQQMSADTSLQQVKLGVIGGEMSVSEEFALHMAAGSTTDSAEAAAKYFAKQTPQILNKSGKNTELHFIYNILYAKMKQYNTKIAADTTKHTMINAGGTGNTNYSIFAIRQAPELNCGLVSPCGKNRDETMYMEWLDDGARHRITTGKDAGKIGYEATWKAFLGYQLACPEYLGGIFNIDPANNHNVTATMIDDLLDAIEADTSDTVLVMARTMKSKLGALKWDKVELENREENINTKVMTWNGIEIIGTNTMLKGTESKVILPY
jgi:hypothetical protein